LSIFITSAFLNLLQGIGEILKKKNFLSRKDCFLLF
jgi:hypothetical protein